MIILLIIITGVIIGIIRGIAECIRNPVIFDNNTTLNHEQENTLEYEKMQLENKIQLISAQIDTLHELNKTIDSQLDYTRNEKERLQLLNKKAITIGKIERLQDKFQKLINELDSL
jgi:hypothetical protein